MTKAMCENFVAEINKMMSDGVDCVEVYTAKPGTKLYNGIFSNEYNSCIEDYIGYTDQFEWDKNSSPIHIHRVRPLALSFCIDKKGD